MGQSKAFYHPADTFDPETLEMLGKAYELAIASLHDRGQPDAICDIIADRIIVAAGRGERDIHQLCRAALRGIALPF